MALLEGSAQPCGCDPGCGGAGYKCERHGDHESGASIQTAYDLIRNTVPPWGEMGTIKDSGERLQFKSGSLRDTETGKIKWSLITWGPMMRRWAQHLTTAEKKYPNPSPGIPNFSLIESEEERVRYRESAFRHFMSWFHGETDEDHAAAVFFNINGVEIINQKRAK